MCFMAEFRLNAPAQRQGATEEEKINDLYRFAGELTKQVRMVLNNLDFDSFGAETQAKIRKAVEVSEAAENNFKEQKDLILSNADAIYSNMDSIEKALSGQIAVVAGQLGILTDISTNFIADGAGLKIRSLVEERLAHLLNTSISSESGSDYEGDRLSVYDGLITMGYDGSEYAITIAGRRDNESVVSAKFTPEKLSFYQDNVELGFFASNRQFNEQIQTKALTVSLDKNSVNGFVLDTDQDGNLRLRYEEALLWAGSTQ